MKASLSNTMYACLLWLVVSFNAQAVIIPVGPPVFSQGTFTYQIQDYNSDTNIYYEEVVPLVGDTAYAVALSHAPVERSFASVGVSGGAISAYLSAGRLNTSTGSINGGHVLEIEWDVRYDVPANAKSASFIVDKSLMHLRGIGYENRDLFAQLSVNITAVDGSTGDILSDLHAKTTIFGKTHDVGDGEWIALEENNNLPGITAEELNFIPPFMDRPGYYTSESFTWDGLDVIKGFPVEEVDLVVFLYNITLTAESDEAAEGIARIEFGDPFGADGIKTEFYDTAVVPIPAAVWLFTSGLIGLITFAKRSKQAV